MSGTRRKYGVKLVRGPFVSLPPNDDACLDESELRLLCDRIRGEDPEALLGADLFAGAGGLSLGLEQAGIEVVVAVDHDKEALETHRHHFKGMTLDWDLSTVNNVERVANLLVENRIDVLAGGPPCQPFSKAGRSLIRHQVRTGVREAHDSRRDLWQSFLEIVSLARPRAVIMENVPDMALDREMFILRSMVLELERMGYGVEVQLIDTARYGVPQFRQRLILVAIADGGRFVWPAPVDTPVSLNDAIGDLPPVEGGWRPDGGADGWAAYGKPETSFQREMRSQVPSFASKRLYDHITRPVRPDDREAFALMDSSTKYSELPSEFKRYRDDIFDDKYKRLDGNALSRTITAHIAKDGYWYIHPSQDRTITIREAARIQTFPDWFRFAGPPSANFRQIGNAVPPRAGRAIAAAVSSALIERSAGPVSSERISKQLATWFEMRRNVSIPWLRASSRWQVLAAERLLERASEQTIRSLWPHLEGIKTPLQALRKEDELVLIGDWAARRHRVDAILTLAKHLVDEGQESLDDEILEDLVSSRIVPRAHADMAALIVGADAKDTAEEPILNTKGILRVAARHSGKPVDLMNRNSDGRIEVARLVGFGADARIAHIALMELANSNCHASLPECVGCPLAQTCASSLEEQQSASMLPGILNLSDEAERSAHLR